VLRLQPQAPDGVTRFAPQWLAPGQKPVALALRGGSAKALAHIGILQRFEEEGIPVGGLTGTSGGALIAGLIGAGYSPKAIQQLFKDIDFGAPLDDRLRSPGCTLSEDEIRRSNLFEIDFVHGNLDLLPGQERARRLSYLLWRLLGRAFLEVGSDFDRGRIPVRIVASDLQSGDPWVFRSGYLPEAVRASMSIPGVLAPVEVRGHQLVDGGLVENLPVAASRQAFPGMLQVGVDIGRSWDASKIMDPGTLMGRSLDTAMRQIERLSHQQADLLLAPHTDTANDFEFREQVDQLVAAGRTAFDEGLPALEALLYGPQATVPEARGLRVEGAAPAGLDALLKACLPREGPLLRRDLFRLLRHLHQSLPIQSAAITLPPRAEGEAVLRLQLQPAVRHVELELDAGLPAAEAARFRRLAAREGLQEGQPFDAVALDGFIRQVAFGETLTSFRGTAFDPATGALHLQAAPIRLKAVEIPPGGFRDAIARLFAPLVGAPISVQALLLHLDETRNRFNCTSLDGQIESTPEGVILHLDPERERVFTLGLQVAYETTWGGHFAVDAKVRNPLGFGSTARFQGSFNSLQQQGTVSLARDLASLPGVGGELYGYGFRETFHSDLRMVGAPPNPGLDSRLKYGGEGLGLWFRFGQEDKALARIDVDQRTSTFDLFGVPEPEGTSQVAQASLEWDNLDYHLLPTSGSVFRLRGGSSLSAEANRVTQDPFEFAHGQFRHLQAIPGVDVSLDLGAELGLGWHTPVDRWYILGGSNSIIGSNSASYLLPNFGTVSLGLPFTSVGVLGLGVQLMPRVDWTRAAASPQQLSGGLRVLGTGLIVRSIVRNFYVELAYGQTQTRGTSTNGTQKNNEVSFLVGARPFDLWKHR